VAQQISGVWRARADRYSEQRGDGTGSRRHVEMFLVGG
jgi:cyclic pyranopterin phosphate synthase